MKFSCVPSVFLFLAVGLSVFAEPWPGQTPVVPSRPDGVTVLNAEAAGFVMSDRLGRHLMNASAPKLHIEEGRITNLGEGAQFPAWRFQVDRPGKYAVYLDAETSASEECEIRVSFYEGKREFRVLASVPRNSPRLVRLGEARFDAGEFEAFLMVGAVTHKRRLPQIRGVCLLPVENEGPAKSRAEQLIAASPKTVFPAAPGSLESTLFPVGNLDEIPVPKRDPKVAVFRFDAPVPPDESARREAFLTRNSPEGLAALARRLRAALRTDVPGLEKFYTACDAGRAEEALSAYREYFFRKLKSPEKFGLAGLTLADEFFQANGKAGFLRPPFPERVRQNMEGVAVYEENGRRIEGRVGAPGAVDWAPASLSLPSGVTYGRGPDGDPFWKTPAGSQLNQKVLFYRALNRLPTMASSTAFFPDLLFSYCFSGNKDHLGRLAEYIDDWSANSVRDLDNCPVNIRAATELQVIGWFRGLLRVILDERPEFAADFPAPTLARYLMALTETFHPYVVRAKRAELANWGIMGVEAAMQDSRHLSEFRSMFDMNRELSRLARINWIHHLTLDGENLEAWDEGHMAIDDLLKTAPQASLHGAPVFGSLEAQAFQDQVKNSQRSLMTHFSPEGDYWVSWRSEEAPSRRSLRGKLIDRGFVEEVLEEPEVRRRFFAALHGTVDRAFPLSDFKPYSQTVYLRDGFGRDSSGLFFQNFPVRSQNQGWGFNQKRGHLTGSMRTQFAIDREGKAVLAASPLLIDTKPPNLFTDLTPTGGKTDYAFQTPRTVQPGRFLSSPSFDVVEGFQDSPYTREEPTVGGGDLLGAFQKGPDPALRGIVATRQIFHLRGEGIFVIGDRLKEPAGHHEFAQMVAVPLRVPGPAPEEKLKVLAQEEVPLVEVDPAVPRIRSLSPDLPNVSLYFAGHDFTFGGRATGRGTFETAGTVTAKDFYERCKSGKTPDKSPAESPPLILSARWSGEGNQALAWVAVSRSGQKDSSSPAAGEISDFAARNGSGGVSGFSFRTASGLDVWFQIAPVPAADLAAGPVTARAGSLLVTKKDGRLAGVVMDGTSVSIDGKTHAGPSDAFEFTREADGKFSAVPVLPPIDTTVISPQQTVFIDKVSVTFDIPTQRRNDVEFRYTRDGSAPTLDSPLYTGPFEIDADTLVKVRPFRKGLSGTPWNIAGVDAGKTVSAVFRKTAPLPALKAEGLQPGLAYEYFEDAWPILMSHSGMYPSLPVKGSGVTPRLLDPAHLAAIRQTDRAYAVKYDGYIEVPESGVYRFFAPEPLYNTTKDAGCDLRVWIDGEEWFPNPDLHAENIWSVALDKGLHRFQVSYVDFRWKKFRNEYWMTWNPGQMAEGVPVLELDGPGLTKRPLPQEWLRNSGRRP